MKSRQPSSAERSGSLDALGLLGSENFERWQRLGRALRSTVPVLTFERGLASDVGDWSSDEQRTWLEAAATLAARAPRAGAAVYRMVPRALRAVPAAVRSSLLRVLALAAAGSEPAELVEILPLLGALVLDVPPSAHADALDLATTVAEDFPTAVPGILRCLPRILEEASGERARNWMSHGLMLARQHRDTGRAYFGLESRTSIRMLHASTTAVTLAEVDGMLQRYMQMLSGIPAMASATGRFRLLPHLEDAPGTGTVALPAMIDTLSTWEENARLFRVVAALIAARREFGTYTDPVATELRHSSRGTVLEACFLLADGYRIACRLAAVYTGIGRDLRWAAERLLSRWSAAAATPLLLFDALLAHALAPDHEPVPGWIVDVAALVRPCLAPLAAPSATARDAAVVAELLATLLSFVDHQDAAEPNIIAAEQFLLDAGDEAPPGGAGEDDPVRDIAGQPGSPEPLSPDDVADLQLRLGELAEEATAAGRPLTADELARLLEAGLIPQVGPTRDATLAQAGLYITQLIGKLLGEKLSRRPGGATAGRPTGRHGSETGGVYLYDEWDHVIDDYRPAWCQLHEVDLGEDAGVFFTSTLERYAPLVPEIRRHFQRVRPERWRIVRGLEDGEDFDLNAVIDARAERRARRSPSPKLYTARARLEREVATLFLLDMSASTDETADVDAARRRIIDIEKEALVIMAAALEELGDAYAIYGFSGQGRHNVEFYPVKAFDERLAAGAKGRIGAIEPRCSTRMGTALRHSLRKMRDVRAPNRHLILISDGFPQDLDYGEDRRSYGYGISDTAAALREMEAAQVKPFCITVDLAGHDYLREMCDPQRYMVIENVGDLPRELPKIYQRLVRAA